MQRSKKILLVQPPVQHPALFAPAVLRAVAVLRREGRSSVLFHAGADFVLNYLAAAPVREQLMGRVQERLHNGDYNGLAEELLRRVERYVGRHDPVDDVSTSAAGDSLRQAAAGATSAACGDPLQLARSVRAFDESLRLVSIAYFPACLDRRGFSHPELDDESSMNTYLRAPEKNPFLEYARHWCRPTVAVEQCEAAVLIAATPGQMVGAMTMAWCWEKMHPAIRIAICAVDEQLQKRAERLLDGVAQRADWKIARIVQRAIKHADDLPIIPAVGEAHDPIGDQQHKQGPIHSALLPPEKLPDFPPSQEGDGGSVIVWEHPEGAPASISRLLFNAAKKGYWNHLVFSARDDQSLVDRLKQLADENPYIVHSWCRRETPVSGYSDAMERYPEESPVYGKTTPMPGRPLWQQLQDPVSLQDCLATHGAKVLAQQRLNHDGSALVTLGNHLVYHYLPPAQLPPGYFDEICMMVEAGGTVGSRWLRHNLERAFLIGYAEENGIIAGNSSLKHPREEYVEAVSEQCGIDLHHYLERGYTSVRPEYRSMGVGAELLEGLTARAEGYRVYSVIAEDNVATQKMAIRNRTRLVASFFSQRTRKQIGIWIPEWMLPGGVQLPRQPDLQ